MNTGELTDATFELLEKVLSEAYKNGIDDDLRLCFIYRHLRNISEISRDVLTLEHHGKSARILLRTTIEGMYSLVAAVKRKEFAPEKMIVEIEDYIRRIQKWLSVFNNDSTRNAMAATVSELQLKADEFRTQHGVVKCRQWNVYETAKVAGLNWSYASNYFVTSEYVHATINGIISQEEQINRGHILSTLISVIHIAVAHAVQILKTDTPQKHVDDATYLLGVTTDLMEQGAFSNETF